MAFKQNYSQKIPQYTVKKKNEYNTGMKIKQPTMSQSAPAQVKIRAPEQPKTPARAVIKPTAPPAPSIPKPTKMPAGTHHTAPKTPAIKPATLKSDSTASKFKPPESAAVPKRPAIHVAPTKTTGSVQKISSVKLPQGMQVPAAVRAKVNYHPSLLPQEYNPALRDAARVQRWILEQAVDYARKGEYENAVAQVRLYNQQRAQPTWIWPAGKSMPEDTKTQDNPRNVWDIIGSTLYSAGIGSTIEGLRQGSVKAVLKSAQSATGNGLNELLQSQLPASVRDVVTFQNITDPVAWGKNIDQNLPTMKKIQQNTANAVNKTGMDIMDDLGISTANFSRLAKPYRDQRYQMWTSSDNSKNIAQYVLTDRLGRNLIDNLGDVPGVYMIDRDILRRRLDSALQTSFDQKTREDVSKLRSIGTGTGQIIPAIPETTELQRPWIVPAPLNRPKDTQPSFIHSNATPNVKWVKKSNKRNFEEMLADEYQRNLLMRDKLKSEIDDYNKQIEENETNIDDLAEKLDKYTYPYPESFQRENDLKQKLENANKFYKEQISTRQKLLRKYQEKIFNAGIERRVDASNANEDKKTDYVKKIGEWLTGLFTKEDDITDINTQIKLAENKVKIEEKVYRKNMQPINRHTEQLEDALKTAWNNVDSAQRAYDDNNKSNRNFALSDAKKAYDEILKDYNKHLKQAADLEKGYKEPVTAAQQIVDDLYKKLEDKKQDKNTHKEKFAEIEKDLIGNIPDSLPNPMRDLRGAVLDQVKNQVNQAIGLDTNNIGGNNGDAIVKNINTFIDETIKNGTEREKDAKSVLTNLRNLGAFGTPLAGYFILNKLAKYATEMQTKSTNPADMIPIGQKPQPPQQNMPIPKLADYTDETIKDAPESELRFALQDYLATPPKTWLDKQLEKIGNYFKPQPAQQQQTEQQQTEQQPAQSTESTGNKSEPVGNKSESQPQQVPMNSEQQNQNIELPIIPKKDEKEDKKEDKTDEEEEIKTTKKTESNNNFKLKGDPLNFTPDPNTNLIKESSEYLSQQQKHEQKYYETFVKGKPLTFQHDNTEYHQPVKKTVKKQPESLFQHVFGMFSKSANRKPVTTKVKNDTMVPLLSGNPPRKGAIPSTNYQPIPVDNEAAPLLQPKHLIIRKGEEILGALGAPIQTAVETVHKKLYGDEEEEKWQQTINNPRKKGD